MTAMELLNWARGPALQAAVIIFVIGMVIRLFEILLLGRKKDLSVARADHIAAGFRTIVTRNVPFKGTWKHQLSGYIWHTGFFIVLLFFAPHIQFFKHTLGISWFAISNSIIDIATIVTMAALMFSLLLRITEPVRRMLSTADDYLAWFVTFLPIATGFMAFHHVIADYTLMLAIHIMSINLLLVVFPFTKLTHAVTVFFSRWYNGAVSGRKGVRV